jgi:hypothetical protein
LQKQLNCHFSPTTEREACINEYLHDQEMQTHTHMPVVGLPEGDILHVHKGKICVWGGRNMDLGKGGIRIYRKHHTQIEIEGMGDREEDISALIYGPAHHRGVGVGVGVGFGG